MSRRIANVLLWIGASIGALSVVATLLVALLGYVPLVFTSGSMSPEISAGALGVAETVSADEVEVGDVVSVESAKGARVTHRIVEIAPGGDDGAAVLTLKGDANETVDADPYAVTEVDRVVFSVPLLGRVLTWLASPAALFVAGVVAAGVVFYIISSRRGPGSRDGHRHGGARRRGNDDGERGGRRRAGATRQISLALASVTVPAMVLVAPAQPTMAAFNDLGATVTTSGFVSHRVMQPATAACTSSGLSVTVSTSVTDPRYTYWARAFNASGAPVSQYKAMTGTGTTRSSTFGLTDFNVSIDVGATYQLRVYARVGNTTWESTDFRRHPFNRTTLLMSCGTAPTTPTINFTEPIDGARRTLTTTTGRVNQFCGSAYGSSAAAACGTVSDDGSIASVEYILQRSGFLVGTRCWDGSSWVLSCTYRPAGRNTTTNPQRWSVPRTTDPYTAYADHTLTIRATDNEGHVTVTMIRFTTALL